MNSYDRLMATALKLIKKKGLPVTWVSIADTTVADPWSGSTQDRTEHTVDMVFMPVDRVDKESLLYREYSDIPIGFEYGYMGAVDFEPCDKDIVISNNKQRNVSKVKKYAPNGVILLYIVEFQL